MNCDDPAGVDVPARGRSMARIHGHCIVGAEGEPACIAGTEGCKVEHTVERFAAGVGVDASAEPARPDIGARGSPCLICGLPYPQDCGRCTRLEATDGVKACGACPGDGSICKTECRLAKESPPVPAAEWIQCDRCGKPWNRGAEPFGHACGVKEDQRG